jgi:hypothetical protein
MALSRFVLTSTVTVPAGTPTAVSGGFGLVSWAGPAGAWAEGFPVTFLKGQVIEMDTATTAGAALQSAIGAGNLRAYVQGTDDRGPSGVSNQMAEGTLVRIYVVNGHRTSAGAGPGSSSCLLPRPARSWPAATAGSSAPTSSRGSRHHLASCSRGDELTTQPGSDPRLPSIKELTIELPGPDRSPAALSANMRHSMGLADAPPRQPDPDAPDVGWLAEELGLQ